MTSYIAAISPSSLPPETSSKWHWEDFVLGPTGMDPATLPAITIVTPSYNKVDFIEQTIRSVLLQGYPKLEYFVMDGGSTDGSAEIVERYGNFLTDWVSEPDRGQSHAINKGWQRSSGRVLAWLNADDMLSPGALWSVARAVLREPQAGMWHGQMKLIDAEGASLGVQGAPLDVESSIATTTNPVAQSSAFLDRAAVIEAGWVDESLEMSMDWDLFIRVALQRDSVFVPEVWSYFRKTREAKTRAIKSGFGFDKLVTLEKVFADPTTAARLARVEREAYANARARCAVGYYRTKRFPEARRTFRQALRSDPRAALSRAGGRMSLRLLLAGPVVKAIARRRR